MAPRQMCNGVACFSGSVKWHINPVTIVSTSALTLNPSPVLEEELPIRLPFSSYGRSDWGMRAVQNARSTIAGLIVELRRSPDEIAR
jgi:hypothetical protein